MELRRILNSLEEAMVIGLPLFKDVTQLDLTGPYEVFTHLPGAQVLLIATDSGPVTSDRGLRLLPDTLRADCPPLDVLCVPGGSGINALIQDDAWLDFLWAQGSRAHFVSSVCTGALALGAAGLLRGYDATTHWLYLDILEACGARPKPGRVVRDRNRFTGGGVTAGIDLALAIGAELVGLEAAKTVQLSLEYRPSPPFASGHPDEADPALVRRIADDPKERDYHDWRRRLVQEAIARRGERPLGTA